MNDRELIWEAYVSGSLDPKKEMIHKIMQNGNISESDAERVFDHYTTATYYRVDKKPLVQLDQKTNTYNYKENDLSYKTINFVLDKLKKDYDVNEFYHAGLKILKVKDIQFDMGALGFHIGKKELVDYISKGLYKKDSGISDYDRQKGKRLQISKFGVVRVCSNNLEIEEIKEDMPWEDPVQLSVYLFYVGLISKIDAIGLLTHFGYQDDRDMEDFNEYDMDYSDSLFTALDKIENNPNYHPVEDIGMMSEHSEFYKNKEALGYLRNLLVNTYNYAGIQYTNEAEGKFIGEDQISICVLDKCILSDID